MRGKMRGKIGGKTRWMRVCVRGNAKGAARDLALPSLAYRDRSPVLFSSGLVFGFWPWLSSLVMHESGLCSWSWLSSFGDA